MKPVFSKIFRFNHEAEKKLVRETMNRTSRTIIKKNEKRGLNWLLDIFSMQRLSSKSKDYYAERGHRLAIFANDNIGHSINQHGIYEREDLELLFEFLAPVLEEIRDGVAIDIGANIGNHSIFFSNYFSQVIAFEPNPHTYRLLDFNIAFRSNISAHNLGLGDEKGGFSLFENTTNFGGSTIREDEGNNSQVGVQINVDTLDACLRTDRRVEFIKIDVEGFEEKVIIGANQIITKHQPIVVFEQHKTDFVDGTTPVIKSLKKLGYRFCWSRSNLSGRSFFIRRLFNFWEVFFGRKLAIETGPNIPVMFHPMMIAIPPKHFASYNMGADFD